MDIYPKHCNKCNTIKSIDSFHKNKSTKDGFNAYCKCCLKETYKKKNNNDKPKRQYKQCTNYIDEYFLDYYQAKKDATAFKRACQKSYKKKREEEPLLKVIRIIRDLVAGAFKRKGYKTNSHTHEIIGCSYEELKSHMENQFTEGMSWDNHGQWHIDHIIPVSYGLNVEEVIALNNYINLQPLWAIDNLRKGNRYIG